MNQTNSDKKPLTTEQAYLKITSFCSFRDRSRKEIIEKLYAMGLSKDMAKNVLIKLEEDGYLNEDRMARSYAGGKFRVKAWGKRKIEAHMKHLGLNEEQIDKGMHEIDSGEYLTKLEYLFDKKWNELNEDIPVKRLSKTIRFLAMKGYEQDLIWDVVRKKNFSSEE